MKYNRVRLEQKERITLDISNEMGVLMDIISIYYMKANECDEVVVFMSLKVDPIIYNN